MLRHTVYEDFGFIYGLYMHPTINPYLLYEPMSEAEFRTVYDSLMLKQVVFVYESEGVPMGMCKLVHQEYRNHHTVYLGGVAIHPDHNGKGHGKRMLEEVITLCRQHDIQRIELSVSVENEKAIRLYEQCGFQQEGRLRRYTHLVSENRYVDEYMMSWLA